MSSKIAVFGSFITDLTGRADGLPKPGQTLLGTAFKMGPGGKGSNQCVAAHRAGADVVMITKIGQDPFGQIALDFYSDEGMRTDYIFRDASKETGTALIIVDNLSGENQILVVSGACGNITDEDILKAGEIIKQSEIILLQLEINFNAVEKIIDIAYKSGVKVVLNPAPAFTLPDRLFMQIDYITPNEHEAYELTGVKVFNKESAEKAADALLAKGVKNVLITMGSSGVFVKQKYKNEIIQPIKVKANDTTGAGDAFNGAFVTALSEGKDVFEAAQFGNAAGALCVTKYGTAPAMPQKSDIEELLKLQRI